MTRPSIWDELVDELGDPLDAGPTPQADRLRTHPTESTPQVPSTGEATGGPEWPQDAEAGHGGTECRQGLRERLRDEWDSRTRAEAWFIAVALGVFVIVLLLFLLGVFPAMVLLS